MTNIAFWVRIVLAVIVTTSLSACATNVEISYSDTRRIDGLNKNLRAVATQKVAEPLLPGAAIGKGEFFLIDLQSRVNIEKVVRQREMAFLYFELRSCGKADEKLVLYSAPAYVDSELPSAKDGAFHYFAPVPLDYWNEVNRYLAMRGIEQVSRPKQICIGLGAGSMAGRSLRTNFVPTVLK